MLNQSSHGPRRYVLLEANYPQLLEVRPSVAVLPWGATEAHGHHLPQGTDVFEATEIAMRATALANDRGARCVVLPTIPFGNDEQQLDQVATISITTGTALAILRDIVRSLARQNIDRLVIVNAHGGNEFKPLVRDLQSEFGTLIVVVNFWQVSKYEHDPRCAVQGDHADEMETSLMLHLRPQLVRMDQVSKGARLPFVIEGLGQSGVWTPRLWSKSHPDTGSGDATYATADKGKAYFEKVCEATSTVLMNLSAAEKGQLPYV